MPLIRKRRAQPDEEPSTPASAPPTQRRNTQLRRRRPDSEDEAASAGSSANEGETQLNGTPTQDTGDGSTRDQMVKKMVRLALASEYARQPIRRADVGVKVLGAHGGRQFKYVFEEAQRELRDKFGMEMTELPVKEKVTISQRRVPTAGTEATYIALYTFIHTLLALSPSGSLPESKLSRYLNRMNLSTSTPLGSTEKLLQRLVKEGYIVRYRDSSGGEEVVEYMVGPRGKVEVGEEGVRGLVRGVYGKVDAEAEELERRIDKGLAIDGEERRRRDEGRQEDGEGTGKKTPGRSRRRAGQDGVVGEAEDDSD
ncbi:MAG: hypothetical protein M1830_008297 [Pleopsidium flavum]|nr:MAG: hypothetical protein M1830_008297 [Pleopsidium flavum]